VLKHSKKVYEKFIGCVWISNGELGNALNIVIYDVVFRA